MLRRFGIAALRPAQRSAIDAVIAGRDVLVVLPTGGGKSLCYQLPACCGAAPTVVVSPLVALMKDQVDALQRRGIAAAQLSGAVSAAQRADAWAQLEARELVLLYLAPEALTARATCERLARAAPRLLAVDEAHCISEWGESFRPDYLRLGEVRDALGSPPTVALTATATPRTAREIIARLRLRSPAVVSGGFDRANLRLIVRPVGTERERAEQLRMLGRSAPGPAVVYASSRRETERWAATYARDGIASAAFHAGLPTDDRARVQDRFQANRVAIIVATNAFGMGVDKPDVRLVVHAAPPLTLEAYYQEAGRGGRDGGMADCILLLGPDDLARARARIRSAQVSESLLASLATLLGRWRKRTPVALTVAGAEHQLAAALGAADRDIAAALRLLREEGVLTTSAGRGRLRVLATSARLAADRSIPPEDAGALRTLLALDVVRSGGTVERPAREFAAAAPDGDVPRLLQRLAERQLAVWQPLELPWRLRRVPSPELVRVLASRHATRQARDAWRLNQVARMVASPRCRRLVLLRYFGDTAPEGRCGACDVCGIRT
jgi:ATP-dependent DNA helicase RecQ